MTTIKSYTDISQSKKLAEILLLETADMYYPWYIEDDGDTIESGHRISTPNIGDFITHKINKMILPCWSLAALLNTLNSIDGWYPGIDAQVGEDNLWQICMFSYETGSDINTAATNKELVDTCYEVILKLKEKNLL